MSPQHNELQHGVTKLQGLYHGYQRFRTFDTYLYWANYALLFSLYFCFDLSLLRSIAIWLGINLTVLVFGRGLAFVSSSNVALLQFKRHEMKVSEILNKIGNCQELPDLAGKSASQLLKSLANGTITSENTTKYFILQAIKAHGEYACLADTMFEEALQRAKKLDQYFQKHKKVSGPLHGLPISIKDCFRWAKTDSTQGISELAFHPEEYSDNSILLLERAGAVIFTKTNSMQFLIGYESVNPVFGRVLNPHDTTRTPGGSSGGESSLISAGGSPIGIGTDIGGSIRMPAAFCGLAGFKPTGRRISRLGWNSGLFQHAIEDSYGPLAKTVEDLILVQKVFFSGAVESSLLMDPTVPPLSFSDDLLAAGLNPLSRTGLLSSSGPLKIGYFLQDGNVHSIYDDHILAVVKKLQSKGFQTEEFNVPLVQIAHELYFSLMSGDGGCSIKSHSVHSHRELEVAMATLDFLPEIVREGIQALLATVLPYYQKLGRIIKLTGKKDSNYLWAEQKFQKQLVQTIFEAFKHAGISILLCPPFPSVPPLNHLEKKTTQFPISYTSLWNFCDFPAGVVPFPKSGWFHKDHFKYEKQRQRGKNFVEDELGKSEAKMSRPLPAALQVVGLPWQDELVLGFMKYVQDVILSE